MAEHTPGPWFVELADDRSYIRQEGIGKDYTIAEVDTWMDEQREADARLIAIAPELLKECESALYDLTRYPRLSARRKERLIERLKAVIAKTGSNGNA